MKLIRVGLSIFCVMIILAGFNKAYAFSEYDSSPAFHDLNKMTAQELAAEMRHVIKTKQDGKFYPPDRINALEKALAAKQKEEMQRFEKQLKNDAAQAKKIEEMKQKAIEAAEEQLNKTYEDNKEEIEKWAEEKVKETIGSERWEKAKDMYEKGSDYYEKNLSDYVDKAKKAYDLYNKYNEAKNSNPDAPESAKNLLGFLGVAGDVMKEVGEKLGESPTPVKIVGQALQAYGEACGLGDTAAKNAWKWAHGGDNTINPMVDSLYKKGLNKLGETEVADKTPLMQYNGDIRILDLGGGRFAAFDSKGNLIPGAAGDTLTRDEYKKIEQIYTSWAQGKKEDWPNLSIEELVKLAKGEKVDITLKDNWIFSDEKKGFTAEDIIGKMSETMSESQRDTLIKEIDRDINGNPGMFDRFTRGGRERDIRKAFYDYLDYIRSTDENYYEKSDIDRLGNFKELVKEMLDKGKKWDEIKEEIKKMKDKAKEDKNEKDKKKKDNDDPAKQKVKEKLGINGKNKDKKTKDKSKDGKDKHWVQKNKDEFDGSKDKGFSKIGNTDRQLPDPFALGIPVLKPNIYIYPVRETDVAVEFIQPENVTKSIPEYDEKNGWDVNVKESGKINNKFDFLFYEANVAKGVFQTEKGWYVTPENRSSRFTEILDLYGFNEKEKYDFIEFWNQKLEKGQSYCMYPQETARIDAVMPVKISPNPESVYRIWFYFIEGSKKDIEVPEDTEVIKRNGYTVIEWGGMVE